MDDDRPLFTCPSCGAQEDFVGFAGQGKIETRGTTTIIQDEGEGRGYFLNDEEEETETIESSVDFYICTHCDQELDNISQYITIRRNQDNQNENETVKIKNISDTKKIIDPERPENRWMREQIYEDLPGTTNVAECPNCGNAFSIANERNIKEITCTNPKCDTVFTLAEIIKTKNAYDRIANSGDPNITTRYIHVPVTGN